MNQKEAGLQFVRNLLIVPEGIEISNQVFTPRLGDTLLIVPEGIEIILTGWTELEILDF